MWYRLKDIRLALKEKDIYFTNRQITYELEKLFGKTTNYHWQLSYNEYRVAIRALIRKHNWKQNISYWGKNEGGQYMKSLNNWLMSKSARLPQSQKPLTEYSGSPQYEMGYICLNNEIVSTITDGSNIWYETHVMNNLGYSVYEVTDPYLSFFGGKNNVYNCGHKCGSYCKVRNIVRPDNITHITQKELYHRALNNKYSDSHYKKLVAIYLASMQLLNMGDKLFLRSKRGRVRINPDIKKIASELSYYAFTTFNNRIVFYYLTMLFDWGLLKCNPEDIKGLTIK